MKIKVFGLTVFELQQDTPPMPSGKPPGTRAAVAKPRCPAPAAVASPPRPLADLDRAAELLPRTSRETLDVNATLRLFGLKDVAVLWQKKYPSGSGGAALKRALGALGRKPALPPRRIRQDPEGLGSGAKQPPAPSVACASLAKPQAVPTQSGKDAPAGEKLQAPLLARDADGRIDIAASLQLLGLATPISLWRGKIQPGSLEHELKKEIARLLARDETVHGITRADIGLAD